MSIGVEGLLAKWRAAMDEVYKAESEFSKAESNVRTTRDQYSRACSIELRARQDYHSALRRQENGK